MSLYIFLSVGFKTILNNNCRRKSRGNSSIIANILFRIYGKWK